MYLAPTILLLFIEPTVIPTVLFPQLLLFCKALNFHLFLNEPIKYIAYSLTRAKKAADSAISTITDYVCTRCAISYTSSC